MASSRGPGDTLIEFPSLGNLPKLRGRVPLGTILLVLLAAFIVFGSFYTIEPEEIGVVTRFGRFVRTTEPGLHFKLPLGLERVLKVPVQRQLKAEFGFRTVEAGVKSQFTSRGYEDESGMLTGDLNAAVVEWVVQYRIVDAYKYLFRVRNVDETFHDLAEAVMRRVVGDRTVNEVLTIGRQEIEDLVQQQLQTLADQYETGIRVDQVVLQSVNPPDPVKPSFNEVNQAEQERERLVNEAQSQYNRVIPKAAGDALKTIEQSEGYAVDRVNRSQGDAARFRALYDEYRQAPEVTRKRIYLETMRDVLPRAGRKIIVDEDAPGIIPLLNLEGAPRVAPEGQPRGGG